MIKMSLIKRDREGREYERQKLKNTIKKDREKGMNKIQEYLWRFVSVSYSNTQGLHQNINDYTENHLHIYNSEQSPTQLQEEQGLIEVFTSFIKRWQYIQRVLGGVWTKTEMTLSG